MDPTTVIPSALKIVFHVCTGAAPYILNRKIADKIKPQIDKIQSAIEDLKIKDMKIARSCLFKFGNFFSS